MTNDDFKKMYEQTEVLFYVIFICIVVGALIGCKTAVILGVFFILVMSCCYIIVKKFPKVDGYKEYVIICIDQLSNENSFLFWATDGKGYTSDINKAGVWKEHPEKIRDVVIDKHELLNHYKVRTVVGESMLELIELQKGKKT